jgi:hypothetical protein
MDITLAFAFASFAALAIAWAVAARRNPIVLSAVEPVRMNRIDGEADRMAG